MSRTHDVITEARQSPRHRLVLPATVVSGSQTIEVMLLDISNEGLLFESSETFSIGQEIEILLKRNRAFRADAVIVWAGEQVYGGRFSQALPIDLLEDLKCLAAPLESLESGQGLTKEQVAVAIGSARRRSGLSATELARRLGVSRPTIWAWETARSSPTRSNLQRLLEVVDDRKLSTKLDPDITPKLTEKSINAIVSRHREQLADELNLSPSSIKIRIVFE